VKKFPYPHNIFPAPLFKMIINRK